MKMIKVMSKKLVRKTIDMISDIADESYEEVDEDADDSESSETTETTETTETDEEDKYEVFWSNFGKNIKLGVIEDSSNRMKLAKLLRFYSTHNENELTSLDEYISRMKEDQDTILYLPGDSKQ